MQKYVTTYKSITSKMVNVMLSRCLILATKLTKNTKNTKELLERENILEKGLF
jgi:hypothetical protein